MTSTLPLHVTCREGDDFVQAVALPPTGPFSAITLTYLDLDDADFCALVGYNPKDVLGDLAGDDAVPVLMLHVTAAMTATRHPGLFYERRQAVIAWQKPTEDAGTVPIVFTIWSQVGYPGPQPECPEPPPEPPPILG